MSTNLRLSDAAAAALRDAARRTGRSQQALLREAVDSYLGLHADPSPLEESIARGLVRRPSVFEDVEPTIQLAVGSSTLALLDRSEER